MALVPHPMDFPFMANVMYLISDNSPENGGTRLIPGSHKWPLLDYKTANSEEIQKKAVSLTAPRGTAIVWEGRLWHGNGLNRSGALKKQHFNSVPAAMGKTTGKPSVQYSRRGFAADNRQTKAHSRI